MKYLKKYKNHKNEQAMIDHKIIRNICKKEPNRTSQNGYRKLDTS